MSLFAVLISSLFLIPLMAALARASGGGIGAHHLSRYNLTWLPEAVFASIIGIVAAMEHGYLHGIVSALAAYIFFQAGHGTVYGMKGWQSSNPNRIQTLERPIRPIFNLFGWSIYTPAYSWAVMGFKGLLIGLPIFPFGLPLSFLWPASYLAGHEKGEWLSGASVGLCLVVFLL